MGFLAKPIGWLLTWMYDMIGNYGITLVILTLIIKLALYPLYAKQIKSTANMSSVQPKMQEIQRKYANDREMMNAKMAELYKEENVNPASGCLPMIVQMIVIFGLFALLRNPIQYLGSSSDMLFAVHSSFLWIADLAQPDKWILPLAAGISTFIAFSMNSMMTQQPGASAAQNKAMNAIMKYFFPLSILWLARSYPAGLAIYWAGGQFMQIFFNLRINKIKAQMNEEKEKRMIAQRAEKELARKKRVRMKGSY